MTFVTDNLVNSYIPIDLILPAEYERANTILTEYLRRVVNSLNDKDIGQYSTISLPNGQKWFTPGNPDIYRFAIRKVVDFGALPNAATKSVAHGIQTTSSTLFTRIYATATDPGAGAIVSSIPIPYIDPAVLANGIQINVDATNVNITTAANYTAYTTTYVVLEYIQNTA